MPIFDFTSSCGFRQVDRYFSSFAESEQPQVCPRCGETMKKEFPLVAFASFVPFTSNHILPTGEPVHVRDRAQLRQLMRENHLVQVGNDPVRRHFGSSEKSIPRGKEIQSTSRLPKRRAQTVTAQEAQKAADWSARTEFGQRSSR